METNSKEAFIPTKRMTADSEFKFMCHKEVKCFTQCCRNIDIPLTPYDVLTIKNRLELTSDQFLALYTDLKIWEKTDLPFITLKLMNDERKSCPFVRDEEGCVIYKDRPTTCRYYPLGVAALSHKEQEMDGGDFYFLIKEPHCLGFEEDRQWTVREWRQDQGVDIRDKINADWMDIIVRKRSFPATIKLTEKSKQMYFMTSYNIDKFKQFVFGSSFLKLYDIDKKTLEKIREDEVELLQFGFKWLKWVLFKQGNFTLNEMEAKNRQNRKSAEM
jgi:hypothetical protein